MGSIGSLDWLIAGILLFSLLMAAAQGFFFEACSLAGVVLGYLLAAWNYQRIAPWFMSYVKTEWVAQLVAFLLIFIAVTALAGVIARISRWAMKEVGLRWFDRLLGAAFGVIRGALMATVLVMAMASFGVGSKMLAESQIAPYLLVIGRGATWLAPSDLRARFRQGLELMQKMEAEHQGSQSPKTAPGKK